MSSSLSPYHLFVGIDIAATSASIACATDPRTVAAAFTIAQTTHLRPVADPHQRTQGRRSTTMNDSSRASSPPAPTIPPDDPRRNRALARPDEDRNLPHIGIVGDTYTVLLTGDDTAGRYCLIDMHVPPGGGPAPHRHDFEESFTILAGEIEVTFRGEKSVVRAGETVNIPANAPHAFRNTSERPARLLCICSPSGQEEFFMAVGVPVASRTAPPPEPDAAAQAAFKAKAEALAPQYRTELLKP